MNDQDRISPNNISTISRRQEIVINEKYQQVDYQVIQVKISKLTQWEIYGRQWQELLMRSCEWKG